MNILHTFKHIIHIYIVKVKYYINKLLVIIDVRVATFIVFYIQQDEIKSGNERERPFASKNMYVKSKLQAKFEMAEHSENILYDKSQYY